MKVEAELQAIYTRFPSLRVNADKDKLAAAATKVLGPAAAKKLLEQLVNKDTYLAARRVALQLQTPPTAAAQQARRIAVAGVSGGGALAAVVAARAGYQVDAYEQRGSYTRNMQFSTRQEAINELASIDQSLADQFLERLSHISESVFTNAKGERKVTFRPKPERGDPLAVPKSGEEMLSGVPISLVETRVMEDLIYEYLATVPGITVHKGWAVSVGAADAEGNFSASAAMKNGPSEDLGRPFLVVAATGGNTPMREAVGIKLAVTSPKMDFIGGIVDKGLGGRALSRRDDYQRADGSTERIITMAMGSALVDKSWVLVGVRPDAPLKVEDGIDPRSPEFVARRQELVETEFRKEAALVMETDLTGVGLHGPFEGSKPTRFTLEQKMSNKAAAGNNFIGIGDFDGTGAFTVGGGAATAMGPHIERFKTLLFDLEMGVEKQVAMKKFSDGAIADTMAWGRRGISDFYPDVDKQVLNDAWVRSVKGWIEGKNDDPLAALEKFLKGMSVALDPIGRTAA